MKQTKEQEFKTDVKELKIMIFKSISQFNTTKPERSQLVVHSALIEVLKDYLDFKINQFVSVSDLTKDS